jgi:probable F420-dependent oxidoreductase
VKFIFQYPEVNGPDGDLLDGGPVAEVAAAAEEAGWYGLAFTEHPVPGARWLAGGGHQTIDPFVALGHAAAVTRNLRLLTYLAVAPYRNPFLLAKSAATVDKLSGGRFILGLGLGYQKSEFFALGADFTERGALLDEALEVLPMHWSGEMFSFQGRHFTARDVMARPRPVQQPIPIWIGGNSEKNLHRIATKAQGWMPLTGSTSMLSTTGAPDYNDPDVLAGKIEELRKLAGERGDGLDVTLAYFELDPSEPTRDAARHQAAFERLAQIGVTHLAVSAHLPDSAATFDFLTKVGAAYLS